MLEKLKVFFMALCDLLKTVLVNLRFALLESRINVTKKSYFVTFGCIAFAMLVALCWNYERSVFNKTNQAAFITFQSDSESLVIGKLNANHADIHNPYGLGLFDENSKVFSPYGSQLGLQGKFFCFLQKFIGHENIVRYSHGFCSLALAVVVMLICLLLWKKYNLLMVLCFYGVFLLSPWIVNFARNLYWVEFTWFIPMLIGLFCSCFIRNKVCRIVSYSLAFLAMLIKSLCGYEYVSTIMLGMISFLLVDFIEALLRKDKVSVCFIAKTGFILGISAFIGFIVALLIHAGIRGNGNIFAGVKSIYKFDVLRRTLGGNAADFPDVYAASLNASIKEVINIYKIFSTEIIAGVSLYCFSLIRILPLFIFYNDLKSKKLNSAEVSLYFVFLLTTLSWFILGKAHSYIHRHMNYVLWYFGFIQICFYVIVKNLIDFPFMSSNKKSSNEKTV